ncbi:MAG: nitroreductase/quinone reductase family protein [Solirubrobacteraceae bacterium]
MSPQPRHVDPHRPRGRLIRAYAAFSATRLGRFVSRTVMWKLDPYVLAATRGRIGLALILPTLLLETRGARTGAVRRNAAIYFHDGDTVTVVASKAGAPHHPAWFHNLRANPDVKVNGLPMRAAIVADAGERERLWALADNVFAPYATYRREAAAVGRVIPIVQLRPRP